MSQFIGGLVPKRPAHLTVLILTFNEALHIERCIASVKPVARRVVVVDCGSTDSTKELADRAGADVLEHSWISHSTQVNWAIEQGACLTTEWVMRLDADEYLDDKLRHDLAERLPTAGKEISGFEVQRSVVFQGKLIRFGGGVSPGWVLRVWRRGTAFCESRWMDEHMVLRFGTTARLQGRLTDNNLNAIGWWVDKHNGYASREALQLLNGEFGFFESDASPGALSASAKSKRLLKNVVYARLPIGARAFLYFIYRMIFRLGVFDGPRGWSFSFLQGFWYRLLVDLKVQEVKRHVRETGSTPISAIRAKLGIDLESTAKEPDSFRATPREKGQV